MPELKFVSDRSIQILLIALIVLVGVGLAATAWMNIVLIKPVETPKPADITVMTVSNPSCYDCWVPNPVFAAIAQTGVNVTSQRELSLGTADGDAAIAKYNVTRLPTVILSGDINKSTQLVSLLEQVAARMVDGSAIIDQLPPPYWSIAADSVVGLVNVTVVIDSSCADCANVSRYLDNMASAGVAFSGRQIFEWDSSAGSEIVAKYNITKVPALVLSPDLAAYPQMVAAWSAVGDTASDGSYVTTAGFPPYLDLATGNVRGRVDVIYFNDSSCDACYNVTVHHDILASAGVKIENETTTDINGTAGKALLAKYNITAVPTVLLSPEADVYDSLKAVWPDVGSVEADGWWVFRNLSQIRGATWKNLTSGQLVNASAG